MFSLLTGVYDSYLAPSQLNLLVVGASGVGKTALLERLKVTQIPKRPLHKFSVTPEALTPVLQESFYESGVEGGPSVGPDTVSETTGSETDSTSVKVSKLVPVMTPQPTPIVVQKRRFNLSICPAPERYSRSAQDQEEEFLLDEPKSAHTSFANAGNSHQSEQQHHGHSNAIDVDDDEEKLPLTIPKSPEAPRRVRCHSKEFDVNELDILNSAATSNDQHPRTTSMESIPLDEAPSLPSLRQNPPTIGKPKGASLLLLQQPQQAYEEYDVKSKAKMLPLTKIRPTIGTNLGKMEMYGAKCHFFDVGGRLRDLWERYYDDCDAVLFCWKLGNDPDAPPHGHEDDDDDDAEPRLDLSQQQAILNEVRASISDDVPFLIFGHVFGNVKTELVNKVYSTDLVLPHYHNNLTGLCLGSAKTGAGVQYAMDWLISLAKRQQKERLAARRKLEEEKDVR